MTKTPEGEGPILRVALFLVAGIFAWLALRLRIAWLRRKYGDVGPVPPDAYGAQGPDPRRRTGDGDDVIEAEYEVVSRKDE